MTVSFASVRRDALSVSASASLLCAEPSPGRSAVTASMPVPRRAASRGARWSRAALRSGSCAGGLFALSLLSQALAQALPGTATIVSGQADIARTANSVTLTQSTQKLITNWTDFSVGAGNSVRFVQPNADAVALNRVTGTTASTIAGSVTGNGRVFLVNPNGVLMSSTANVSLGSLVASTLDITDNDFLSGNYRFKGSATTQVVNQGRVAVATPSNDAYVALIANEVTNAGTLNASTHGTVALGAGSEVTLQMGGPIQLRVDAGAARAIINNSGSALVSAGQLLLQARAGAGPSTVHINQTGALDASSLSETPGGRVLLTATGGLITVAGSIQADGAKDGGSIGFQADNLTVTTQVSASGRLNGGGEGGVVRADVANLIDLTSGAALAATGDRGGLIDLVASDTLRNAGGMRTFGQPGQSGEIRLTAGRSLEAAGGLTQAYGSGGRLVLTAPSLSVGTATASNRIDAARLGEWLQNRESVQLRSSSDLTVDAGVRAVGAAGALGLTAGRSVLLNSAVDLGAGALTVVANSQEADLKALRGSGPGSLTMGANASLITLGSVHLKMDGDAAGTGSGSMGLTTVRAGGLTVDAPFLGATATVASRVYDGTREAPLTGIDVPTLTLTGSNLSLVATGSFADKAAGTGKPVAVRFALAGFDAADPANTTELLSRGKALTVERLADITPRALQVSQLTGTNKIYDGLTAATVQIGADDRVQGDQLTLTATGRFADKHVGSGKRITVQNVRLEGTDAANYTVDATGLTAQADITPRRLTLTGAFAADKTYDGTTMATVGFVRDDRIAGDVITAEAQGRFSSKDVGTGKRVQVGTVTLGGSDAGNYEAVTSEIFTSADITRRTLTVSELTGQTKVYDGTRAAQVTVGRDDRISGDDLQIAATGSFDTRQAGTGKRIEVQGLTLTGASAGNYTVSATGLTTTGTIERRTLLLSGLTASDKIYDGNTAAQVRFARDDRLAGDDVQVTATGAFDDKRAGFNKQVTASASLAGADAGNYVVSLADRTTQATVLQRALTLTDLTATNRVYDGTRAATVSYGGDNRLSGDQLTVTATAQFDNAHAGTGKQVTVTHTTLSGTDAGNYRVEAAPFVATADITRRSLLVGDLTGQNKVYDGTRVAQVQIGFDNRIAGDDLQFHTTASFDTRQAGTGKRITVEDIRLTGANAGDYRVETASLFAAADIQRRVLSLSGLSAQDKTYDGTALAEVSYARNDRVAGDQVQVTASGSFSNKQAGINKLVTVNGVTLSGADADNYVVEMNGDTTRATIDPRLLTLGGLTAGDKVYDGNRVAQTRYTTDDRVAGDEVQIHTTSSFDDKHAGVGKTVTVNQIGLSGADAGNYRVEGIGATTTATIDQRLLTLTQLAALDKIYDQTQHADVSAGSDDRVRGDQLTVALTGAFDSRHVGRDKTVTVTGIQLSGADASNYRVTEEPLTTQASITPRLLKVGITASDKIYDGQREASAEFTDDRLAGDQLQLDGGTHRFADAQAGKGKTVTASGWQLTGDDAGNYQLDAASWHTTANILPRVLHVTAPSSVEFSKSLRPQTLPIGHDALSIDPIQVVAGSLRWGPADGLPRAAMLGDLAIQGPGAGNYVLNMPTLTTLAIVKAPLPLPGTSGDWLCNGLGGSCASSWDSRSGTAGAKPGPASEAGVTPSAQAPAQAPALVLRRGGIQMPTQHLKEAGE